jgi:excisionase family DNA binding protein
MEGDTDRTIPQESMSVTEAAAFLGVTEDAVRKRIHRGKIRFERDTEGRYIVYPTEDDIRQTAPREYVQSESSALIFELRAQLRRLEDQLEQANERDKETRRLLAAALERIPPQLEAPSEPRESPQTATERAAVDQEEGTQQRPWWRRVFGS